MTDQERIAALEARVAKLEDLRKPAWPGEQFIGRDESGTVRNYRGDEARRRREDFMRARGA